MKLSSTIGLVLLSCLAFQLLPKEVKAQDSVSDFLLTAFEDRNLAHYDSRIAFLKPRNYRFPVLEEVEVRMGNDEQTYEDIQYALRVRPGNPWRIRRNNAFFNATKKELQLQKKLEYKDNIFLRYEVALEYFYNRDLADQIDERMQLISRKASIMEDNIDSDLFDAKDYSEAKLEQVESIEKLDEAVVELNQAKTEIQLVLEIESLNWENFSIIEVAEINQISEDIASVSELSTELDLIAQQIDVARQDTRVEKADFDIGFAQLEYYPFTDRKSNYGFSVGVTLPIFKDNKPQIAERKMDELELRSEYDAEQFQDSVNKIREFEHLKNLIAHHELIQEKKEKLNLLAMTDNLANSEGFDPITILDLKEGILKLDEVILKSRYRVLSQFIDFLYTYDVLTKTPLTNYLSKDLSLIE
ncbi:MAG: hypothetical protein CL670_16240 [Balneola sp.]|jgi:hypothetical protein|nr:hypothetical protein [Balneola sp.]MBE80710.1 hypothetical protein [Balneola sp.]|tara:strand:- start:257 stop:1501 length:1245 start_codon:yes stop_codon:yes gene_type:complete